MNTYGNYTSQGCCFLRKFKIYFSNSIHISKGLKPSNLTFITPRVWTLQAAQCMKEGSMIVNH